MSANWVDLAVLALLGVGAYYGVREGFIKLVLTGAGMFAGIFLAGRLYGPVAAFLNQSGLVADANWARIAAFTLVPTIFTIGLRLLGTGLRLASRFLLVGPVDRALGGLIGFAAASALAVTLIVVATVFPVPNVSDAAKASASAHWLGGLTPAVLALLPPEFTAFRRLMGWGG